MLNPRPRALHTLSNRILLTTLEGRDSYPHFTDEETDEATEWLSNVSDITQLSEWESRDSNPDILVPEPSINHQRRSVSLQSSPPFILHEWGWVLVGGGEAGLDEVEDRGKGFHCLWSFTLDTQ